MYVSSAVVYLTALLSWNDFVVDIGLSGVFAETTSPPSRQRVREDRVPRGSTIDDTPEFNVTDLGKEAGVGVTVTAPSRLFDEFLYVEVSSSAVEFCVPVSPANTDDSGGGSGDSRVERFAVFDHLNLNSYCIQLTTSCNKYSKKRRRKSPPGRCRDRPFTVGVDGKLWRSNTSVSEARQADTATGPAVSVQVLQHGHRFPKLVLSHDGCLDPNLRQEREIADGQSHLLNSDCPLAYDRSILLRVRPSTRFCNETHNCYHKKVELPAMSRQSPPSPETVRQADPPLLLTAGLPLLGVALLAAAGAGLLWLRRSQRRALHGLTARENPGFHQELAGAPEAVRPAGVLLLHLARSEAERTAVQRLAAALRARGAAVTDSGGPEWRRAALRDGTAPLPAGGRVLLLNSPAAAAAVAAGGPGEQERLLAAAVRQLAGGRHQADYGRLYQARLTSDTAALAGLVPGAVYTLPEHQQELVTALLAGTGTTDSSGGRTDTNGGTSPDAKVDIGRDTSP